MRINAVEPCATWRFALHQARSAPVLPRAGRRFARGHILLVVLSLVLAAGPACRRAETGSSRSFATPEDAAKALIAATASEKVDDILQIFGPQGKELIDASDPLDVAWAVKC